MEKKSKWWLWLLVGVLCLMAVGGGVWLGFKKPTIEELRSKGTFVLTGEYLKESGVDIEGIAEGSEVVVRVEDWDLEDLILGFSRGNKGGSFKLDLARTRVVLKVRDLDEKVVEHSLMSTSSPYWQSIFCVEDYLVFELRDSAVGKGESLNSIKGEDVVKITNLGPSKCREEK